MVSTGDLGTVFQRMDSVLTQQLQNITHEARTATITQNNWLRGLSLFSRVNSKVSTFALTIAFKEYGKYKLDQLSNKESEKLTQCKRILHTTMGIPCAHMIKRLMLSPEEPFLRKKHFHEQWWLRKSVVFTQENINNASEESNTTADNDEDDYILSQKQKPYPPPPVYTADSEDAAFFY